MPNKRHEYLVQKTKEKLQKEGYKVDDSSNKLALAINEGGVNIGNLSDVGDPDLIAVKDKKVLAVDVVDGTWAWEMVEKVKKYSKIGKVVFVMHAQSFKDVQFWSLSELGVSISEIENLVK